MAQLFKGRGGAARAQKQCGVSNHLSTLLDGQVLSSNTPLSFSCANGRQIRTKDDSSKKRRCHDDEVASMHTRTAIVAICLRYTCVRMHRCISLYFRIAVLLITIMHRLVHVLVSLMMTK